MADNIIPEELEEFARNVGELDEEDARKWLPILPALHFGVCDECHEWRPKEDLWWLCKVPEEKGPITGWDLYGSGTPWCCIKCSSNHGLVGFIYSAFSEYMETYTPFGAPKYTREDFGVAEEDWVELPEPEGGVTSTGRPISAITMKEVEIISNGFVASLSAQTQRMLEDAFFRDILSGRQEEIAVGLCFAEIDAYLDERFG